MKKVADFVAEERLAVVADDKKRNKLIFFFDDIKYLRNEGMTAPQIQKFLAQNSLIVSVTAIYNFLKKYDLTTKAQATQAPKAPKSAELNESRLPQFLSKKEKQHYMDMESLI